MAESTPARAADRNLLFGMLALQMDFISRDALIQAMRASALEKLKPLGQILQEQGALAEDTHQLLEALVEKHLALHDNDIEKSLAAVNSVVSVREELEQIADTELNANLASMFTMRLEAANREAARGSSVGAPTSAGLRFRIL